jgi:hypothetical protein
MVPVYGSPTSPRRTPMLEQLTADPDGRDRHTPRAARPLVATFVPREPRRTALPGRQIGQPVKGVRSVARTNLRGSTPAAGVPVEATASALLRCRWPPTKSSRRGCQPLPEQSHPKLRGANAVVRALQSTPGSEDLAVSTPRNSRTDRFLAQPCPQLIKLTDRPAMGIASHFGSEALLSRR